MGPQPDARAALSTWECKLDAIVKRLRYSKCGKRQSRYGAA
jgi:hypothetical protein